MSKYESVYDKHVIECTGKILLYTVWVLIILLLGIIGFVIFNAQKLKLSKEHWFLIQ